tara:strand:- start:204 stop:665 length:462 start_codon:yes stop_codon:yes gene_type:complete
MVFVDLTLDGMVGKLRDPVGPYERTQTERFDVLCSASDIADDCIAEVEFAFGQEAADLFMDACYEALGNAVDWGIKGGPERFVKTTSHYGRNGVLLSIENSGGGFDYAAKIGAFRRGEPYSDQSSGKGFVLFNRDEIEVSYDMDGRRINLMIT